MMDQFINFVIRPPRADYNPDQYLWEKDFTLANRNYSRLDIELSNQRGHTLQCSHYVPSTFPEDTPLPCVVYCHGNSGCRADANGAAVILLPLNITVFTLDFSGSGLSDGDYVSLGCHEKDDLKVVVSYLRSNPQTSCIGLWGRSMGAVTSLLYGAEDPSIAGMVLDSAFANLFDLMMELVDVYKIRLPKFTVKVALQYMRRVIQKKAKFDIMDLNCKQVAPKTFIPALFGHAIGDKFVQSHHSDLIFKAYAGDKNIIKFDASRVSSVYSSKLERYYDLGGLKVGAGMDENLLYEIIAGLQVMEPNGTSSSSAAPDIFTATSVSELLSAAAPATTDLMANESNLLNDEILPDLQDDDCCSYTSSTRESWGRCSSLGSNDEPTSDCAAAYSSHEGTSKVLSTPLHINGRSESLNTKQEEKTAKKPSTDSKKKPKRDKLEKLETLSQRLRLCILKRVNPRRHSSS